MVGARSREIVRTDRTGPVEGLAGRGIAQDHADLSPGVAGPMREQQVIVVLRALPARTPLRDTKLTRLLRQQRAQIHMPRPLGLPPGQPLVDIDTDLITAPTNRRPE